MAQPFKTYNPLLVAAILLPLMASCGGSGNDSTNIAPYTGLWEDRVSWEEEITGDSFRSSRYGGNVEPLLIEDFGSYFLVTWCRSRRQERLEVIDSQITFPATDSRPAITLDLKNSATIYGEQTYTLNELPRKEIHEVLKLSTVNQFDSGSASLSLSSSDTPNATELAGSATSDTCVYSALEETYDVSLAELRDIIDDPIRRARDVYFDTKTLTIIAPLQSNDYAHFTFSFRDEASVRLTGNGKRYDLEENATQFQLSYSEVEDFTGIENNQGATGSFTFDSYNFIAGFSIDLLENFDDPLSGEIVSLLNTVGSFNATLEDGSLVTGDFDVTQ